MNQALSLAEKALAAGDFPVGCIIVNDGKIIATGERRHSIASGFTELDHAEIVALRNLQNSGKDFLPEKLTVYSTMEPCLMCYATLLLNKIGTVVWAYEDVMGGGTSLPMGELTPLYRTLQPKLVTHILRQESLALFKTFFQNPANTYWQNSFLEEYTLNQP